MDRNYHIDFLRPLKEGDTRYVADNLRQADIDEVVAAYGPIATPRGVIEASVVATPDPCTITSPCGSGEPVAIIGTTPGTLLGGEPASPWMLGTEKIMNFPRPFVVGGRGYVRAMLERYDILANYVDVRNIVSVRWLKAIGFKLDDPKPYGPAGLPFHRFSAGGIHATA